MYVRCIGCYSCCRFSKFISESQCWLHTNCSYEMNLRRAVASSRFGVGRDGCGRLSQSNLYTLRNVLEPENDRVQLSARDHALPEMRHHDGVTHGPESIEGDVTDPTEIRPEHLAALESLRYADALLDLFELG